MTLMVSCVAETEHSDVSSAAASVFKRVSLDAKILVSLLERMRDVTIETPVQSSKKRYKLLFSIWIQSVLTK